MIKQISYYSVLLLMCVDISTGWRAIPANQAMYAQRSIRAGTNPAGLAPPRPKINDEDLPRTYLHSTFKYGYCRPDITVKQFLRKTVNMTVNTWQDAQSNYIYLLEDKHTHRYKLQCIVMKVYVPRKYLFRRSRIPVYYCQGTLMIMMLNTIHKIELHEFYFQVRLNMPIGFVFEFYHPQFLKK